MLPISNIETRRQTDTVIESWKPVLANAIQEWTKQRMLSIVLSNPSPVDNGQDSGSSTSKVVTTKEELEGFETLQRLLGPERPVAYEDTVSYFKIHLAERHTWVICRLYFDRKRPCIWVPLPMEQTQQLAPSFAITVPQLGWSCVNLDSSHDLDSLGDLLRAAWDYQRSLHPVNSDLTGLQAAVSREPRTEPESDLKPRFESDSIPLHQVNGGQDQNKPH